MAVTAATEGVLPDGSTWLVEPAGIDCSVISRLVDGRCVWAQVFARREDHEGQVLDVLAYMEAGPASFHRWWLA